MASPCIAVFGSSEPVEQEPAYELARELGRLLAGAGFGVVTGGYGGVMEAASRGAREAGGSTTGVICEIFEGRAPNRWLTALAPTPDLHERTRVLIERADGFVVLPGKAGTLAELSMLWALMRAGCLGRRSVVLLGAGLRSLLDHLRSEGMLESGQTDRTHWAATPEAALRVLQEQWDGTEGRG